MKLKGKQEKTVEGGTKGWWLLLVWDVGIPHSHICWAKASVDVEAVL